MPTTVRDEINRLQSNGSLWMDIFDPKFKKIVLVQILAREVQMFIRDYLVSVHRSWVHRKDLSCIPMSVDEVEIQPSGSILFMPNPSCKHRGMSYVQLFTSFLEDVMRVAIVPEHALGEYQHLLSKLLVCQTQDQLISLWYHPFLQSVGERGTFPNDVTVALDTCQDLVFREYWMDNYFSWACSKDDYKSDSYDLEKIASKFPFTTKIYRKSDQYDNHVFVGNALPDDHYGEWRFAINIIVHPGFKIKKIVHVCAVLLSLFKCKLGMKIFDFLWDKGVWIDFKAFSTSKGRGSIWDCLEKLEGLAR